MSDCFNAKAANYPHILRKTLDKAIANRAESIINLTRSLAKIVGKKRSAHK